MTIRGAARFAAALVLSVLASTEASQAAGAAPETTEVFVGVGRGVAPEAHALAHRFILDGTVVVRRGETVLQPEADFRLDPDAGVLQLAEPLAEGARLEVSYAWAPIDLPREWVALVREEPTAPESSHVARPASVPLGDRVARAVQSDLVIGGAKTLTIETGTNRDAAVEQSLRVSVTGKVGEDVRLIALLSDQNIPLQPEGNTQRLEELDEILIKIEGPRAAATLGDFVTRRDGSAFGDFERRLSGAEAALSHGPARVRGVGASARGDFRTVEFQGVEGKQGPYVLAGQGPNPAGVIVAGSERVWVDGRPLTRGDNQDYVVDYSRGELEFTNRVLITEDSEIAVDFEVADQPYDRSLFLGDGGWGGPNDKFSWRTGIVAESDDEEPRDVTLTDERRAALEAAGDGVVLVSGIVCGVEDGDYEPEAEHFVFAGADSGTCDVSFTLVGAGVGDYVRDRDVDSGLVFFRFVGAGLGDYTPGLLLAPPRRQSLADASLRFGGWQGLALHADGAVSEQDRNSLSGLDDGDNQGSAGRAALDWQSPTLADWRGPVRLRTTGSFRSEEAEFAALGRTRPVYLGEVWNFADTMRADEVASEAGITLAAGERWNVGGGLGVLDRTGRFRSTRTEGHGAWSSRWIPTASAALETARREDDADSLGSVIGDLERQRAEVVGALGFVRPGVSWWREDRTNKRAGALLSGADDAEIAATLAVAPNAIVRTDLRVAQRTTDVVDAGRWVRESVGRTVEVKSEAGGRRLRARASWIHRDLDFEAGRPQTDRTTNLTRADLSHETWGGLVLGEYVYETTSRSARDLLEPEAGVERPTLALDASARIVVGGGRASSGTSRHPLSWVRAETFARVDEETARPERGPIYRLDFSRFRDAEHTVFGQLLLREEVTLFPGASRFTLTGRWERTDTADNRVASSPLDLRSERTVARARNALSARWTLESQGTWQIDRRGAAAASTLDFEIRLREVREELVWQPTPAARVSGTAGVVTERDEVSGASIAGTLVGMTLQTAILTSGRLRAEATWTNPRDRDGVDRSGRFRTEETNEVEWRSSFDLKASDTINVSFAYSGRALEDAPTTHLARAEARALF